MSQQINLYNPIFRPKKVSVFSANGILYGVGITLAICAFIAVYADNQMRAVQVRARVADQAQKDAAALFEQTSAAAGKKEPATQLDTDLAALENQVKGRQDVVLALNSGVIGNSVGFSQYMQAFARQGVNGLWLTGFDITGRELALQGRATSADLVATYLKQLNRENLLQGRTFAALRISQPSRDASQVQTSDTPEDSKADAKNPKPVAPRYLEFSISTIESDAARAGKPAPGAPLLGNLDLSRESLRVRK